MEVSFRHGREKDDLFAVLLVKARHGLHAPSCPELFVLDRHEPFLRQLDRRPEAYSRETGKTGIVSPFDPEWAVHVGGQKT